MSGWTMQKLVLANLALAGAAFCFSCFSVFSQKFLKELNSPSWVGATIMLIEHFVGFFVQPLAGLLSDRTTTKIGRRRPFLIVGAVLLSISQIFIGMAAEIAGLIFATDSAQYFQFVRIWLVCGYFAANFSFNLEVVAFRALIADVVPISIQNWSVMAAGTMIGGAFLINNVIVFILDELKVSRYQEIFPLLSVVAALINVILVLPTIFSANEKVVIEKQRGSYGKQLFAELKAMNKVFSILMLPLLFGWCGYLPVQQYVDLVFAQNTLPKICLHGVSAIASPIFGKFLHKLGERRVFIVGGWTYLAATSFLILSCLIKGFLNIWSLSAEFALIGLLNCANNTLPFVYVAKLAPIQSRGLHTGVFNCANVLGKVVANVILVIVKSCDTNLDNTLWSTMVFGVVVGVCVMFCEDSDKLQKHGEVEEKEQLI